MLGAIRQHQPGDAGAKYDRLSRALGRVRDQDAATVDQGESRASAESGDSLEFAVDQEAVHHAVLRSKGPCHPIVGRQQLARDARFAGGWLSRDPVARGCLVSGLRFRQVAGKRRSSLWRVPNLADRLQSSSVEGLSPAVSIVGARRRSGDLDGADRTIVPGTSTMAQGVCARRTSVVRLCLFVLTAYSNKLRSTKCEI